MSEEEDDDVSEVDDDDVTELDMTMSTDAETGVALMSLRGGWMRRLEYAQGEMQV